MNKIIISETFLNELLTKHNEMGNESSFSKVYLGDKWVKKISKNDEYPESELAQYKLMEQNPEFFPVTKIKYLNSGVVILQQKMNVRKAQLIWDQVEYYFIQYYNRWSFKKFVCNLAEDGLNDVLEKMMNRVLRDGHRVADTKLKYRFREYLQLSLELHELIKKDSTLKKYYIDLHGENYGLDDNNNLKIIDFIV